MDFFINLTDLDVMSRTLHSVVFPIGDKEVGKLLIKNSKRDIEWEAERLSFANQVNDLLIKFLRIETISGYHVMVTERIYPMSRNAFSEGEKKAMLAVYKDKLLALHDAGFAHCDIGEYALNKTRVLGQEDNECLTQQGIRLLDAGESMLKKDVGEGIFEQACSSDLGTFPDQNKPNFFTTDLHNEGPEGNPFRTIQPD